MEPQAPKSYEAFRVQPIIETLPGNQRVESLCHWNGYLLAGLQDGTIVQCSGQQGEGPWQIVRRHRSLERKAVVQMAAVQLGNRPLLLTLTEDGVNLLTLPDMKLKFQPMGSRGASVFAWNEESQLLAVAVRRKVILYHLQGSNLLDAGERTAPDPVSTMVWVAAGMLLLGMRRQYVLLNTTMGAVTEVGLTGSAPHPLGVLCPGGREMLLARDSSTFYYNTVDGRYSRRRHLQWSEPLLALTAAGQHAVAMTPSGLEVRSLRRVAEGHVVQRVILPEPQRPVMPAVSEDGSVFVVAAAAVAATGPTQPAGVQATAAAGNTVLRLAPVPLEEQAHTLAKMGEYGEALALAALLDDEEGEASPPGCGAGQAAVAAAEREPSAAVDSARSHHGAVSGAAPAATEGSGWSSGLSWSYGSSSRRRELLEERLRLAYGHYLFQEGEYDEGMAQLALCRSTTALVLLRLFPSLVPPKFKHYLPTDAVGQPLPTVLEPTGEAYATAVSQLLPYILSHRTRAMNALSDEEASMSQIVTFSGKRKDKGKEELGSASVVNGSLARVNGAASINRATLGAGTASGWTGTPDSPAAAATAAVHGENLPEQHAAIAVVAAEGMGSSAILSEVPAPTGNGAVGRGYGDTTADVGTLSIPPPPPPRELLIILDTAIVRIMVAMPDTGALLRFVQLPNYVDLQEGEKALEESGMYAELAALYKCNGCHEEGLELLRKLSQDPGALPRPARGAAADLPGLPSVWAAVRYMVSLSAADADAIQRHAGWILAADAEAGLSALLHMRPPLHPSLALSILNQHSAHYCGLYLETALQIGVALPQDYHNELLLIYLRDILSKEPLLSSRASDHSGEELKELLLSHRPDPDQPPLLFPENLTHALLKPMSSVAAAAAVGLTRRFASAPASSVGTPTGMSRAGSQASMQSSGGGGGANRAAARPGQGTATGTPQSSSTEETGASSGSEDRDDVEMHESKHEAEVQRPLRPITPSGHGTSMRPAVPRPQRPRVVPNALPAKTLDAEQPRRPRRPRRSSADTLGTFAAAKPAPTHGSAAAAPPASPPGGVDMDTNASAAASAATAAAAAAGPSLYQRLRDLVYTSQYIDPSYVLDKLPLGELLEIRALMLERLGNHREALRLYVHALRDLAAAEAYCDRVYAAAVATTVGGAAGTAASSFLQSGSAIGWGLTALDAGALGDLVHPGDIYLELVRALYDGPESCPSARAMAGANGIGDGGGIRAGAGGQAVMGDWLVPPSPMISREGAQLDPATWQALSRLLSRKRDRLGPMQVLDMLPDEVAVADVLPWLESALRFTLEARRNLAVIRQLRRIENLSALEDAVHMRQHRVVITSERACSLCHKRLGGAAFVSYPGGLLAHYSCHMRHTGGPSGAESTVAGAGGGIAAAAFGAGGLGGVGGLEVGGHVVGLQHGTVRGIRGPSVTGAEVAAWA